MTEGSEISSLLDKIRRTTLETIDPDHSYHLRSLLNWRRYVKYNLRVKNRSQGSARIVDVGCGAGHTTAMLKVFLPRAEVMGVDRDKRNVESWKKLRGFCAEFIVGDAERLCFRDECFDSVVSYGVIEHTESEKTFLKETFRILKRHGWYFLFDLPKKFGLSGIVGRILLRDRWHIRSHSPRSVEEMLKDLAYSVEVRREHLLPAQLHRLGDRLGRVADRYCSILSALDEASGRTPLGLLCQSLTVSCRRR
mgnify:CR=1 FL=1